MDGSVRLSDVGCIIWVGVLSSKTLFSKALSSKEHWSNGTLVERNIGRTEHSYNGTFV